MPEHKKGVTYTISVQLCKRNRHIFHALLSGVFCPRSPYVSLSLSEGFPTQSCLNGVSDLPLNRRHISFILHFALEDFLAVEKSAVSWKELLDNLCSVPKNSTLGRRDLFRCQSMRRVVTWTFRRPEWTPSFPNSVWPGTPHTESSPMRSSGLEPIFNNNK